MSNEFTVPDNATLNLSDFALFLSVMKNKEAHESILSIIMDEENLKLSDIKVEQVILNRTGKRAIRLDAWAVDTASRQFNTEMQNDTSGDDIWKRSRFYQGLIDTPVLKSGKETRYRELPSTVIIFITQEDIFGKDLAKYTFTEQCEEVVGLRLEDGTSKIFLNMKSKNGRPELISLLQYMKQTNINNPEIPIKDGRIARLDEIVTEVKQSEEWEDVKMNLLEYGIEQGMERGGSRKLIEMVCRKMRKGKPAVLIADELEEDYQTVAQFCGIAEDFAPDYDEEAVWKKYLEERG